MAEQTPIKAALTAPLTGTFWVKSVLYGAAFLLVCGVCYGVWWGFHKPTQVVNVAKGATATFHTDASKRSFILFAEPFVQVDTRVEGQHGSIGIRAGCRWEF